MTLNTCLALTDTILPNSMDVEVKCRWLSELEGRIRVELLGESPSGTPFDLTESGHAELTVPYPYDQLYWMYLCAMIEYAMGDTARYENGAALFNTAYQNYAKYLIRTKGSGKN